MHEFLVQPRPVKADLAVFSERIAEVRGDQPRRGLIQAAVAQLIEEAAEFRVEFRHHRGKAAVQPVPGIEIGAVEQAGRRIGKRNDRLFFNWRREGSRGLGRFGLGQLFIPRVQFLLGIRFSFLFDNLVLFRLELLLLVLDIFQIGLEHVLLNVPRRNQPIGFDPE